MSLPEIVARAPAAKLPDARPLGLPTAVSADLLEPPRRLQHLSILASAMVIAVGCIWASQAQVQEFAVGQGKVIPARKLQVVQSLEGGIVRAIAVKEGQQVRAGDLLLSIDPTAPGAQLAEGREKSAGLMAAAARLDAEAKGVAPIFPDEIAARRPDIITTERALHESRRRELDSALSALDLQIRQREQEVIETQAKIDSLKATLAVARREWDLVRPLVASGAAARVEGLRAEGKIVETEGALRGAELALPRVEAALAEARDKRSEKQQSFRSDALARLAQAENELAALTQAMRGAEDKVRRTDMTAPVNGIVKSVNITTIGQVIQPGSSAMEIVPLDETLLVEAQIRPQDIAFLRPGLDAMVKLSAYDSTIYGGLPATLEHIGADSVTTEKGETYYVIRVRTRAAALRHRDRDLPIIPGMVAEVEVKTGEKTVMQYLLKPMTRMKQQALRER
jgi:membrane fusion protein, adhesin transport system